MAGCPFSAVLDEVIDLDETEPAHTFPLMPVGQAVDMGHAPDGTPLIDLKPIRCPAPAAGSDSGA